MIRYRRLNESEESNIKLYDVVKCCGYEWYIIDMKNDIVTLLAKNDNFGYHRFDGKSNDYKNSDIRDFLLSSVFPKLQDANPIPTRLTDVGVTDKVWLLSLDEAKELPVSIRQFKDWWSLRSPGWESINAAFVNYNGKIYESGVNVRFGDGIVRPAIRVRIEELQSLVAY